MTAFAVMEPLDVIEDISLRCLPAFVGLPFDSLTFEQREEALQWRIVVTVPSCTHTTWGSTPIKRTLQKSPIMGVEECHVKTQEVFKRV